jgi:MOSC domain-containing protein YiiM
MRIVSVNVGWPREVEWKGRTLTTGIFKEPVGRRVGIKRLNLDGDGQANLKVHGGVDQAVYLYPAEHYGYWRGEFPGLDLPCGMFGENLTTEGLVENSVRIGDRFRFGTAELRATGPRMPCSKLNMRFDRDDMIRRFLESERCGIYLSVEREGEVGADDPIEPIHREDHDVTVVDVVRALSSRRNDPIYLRRVAAVDSLAANWLEKINERIPS